MEMMVVEYFSILYIIEDIPAFGTKNHAGEFLRRLQSTLEVQDKDQQGFATPYINHIHASMPKLYQLYQAATKCPWGIEIHDCPGKHIFLKGKVLKS